MKKRILATAVVLICLSILATTTLAYFTDVDTARNVITSGGIDIELVEQQMVGDQLLPYPDKAIDAMPGKTVSKIVSVQNLQQTSWIRAKVEVTFVDASGNEMELTDAEVEELVLIAVDSENWTLQDGWWYCNAPVEMGESTANLFETVTFAKTMDNPFQGSRVYIEVTADAVQKANNGDTVFDASGWSED